MPSNQPPPSASDSVLRFNCLSDSDETDSSRLTHSTAASSSKAAMTSRLVGPSGTASQTVSAGPASAPALPPAAMTAKRRLPCSEENRSAMNDQNTDTAKRLKTLIQTKNTRATASRSTSKVSSSQKIAMLA